MMLDEEAGQAGGDNETSTYSKFKTVNEMDIEKTFEIGPKAIELDELDELAGFGTIR